MGRMQDFQHSIHHQRLWIGDHLAALPVVVLRIALHVNKLPPRQGHTRPAGEELAFEGQAHGHRANIHLKGSQPGHLQQGLGAHPAQALLQQTAVGDLELGAIQRAEVQGPQHLRRYLVVALLAAPAEVIEQEDLGVGEEDLQVQLLVVSVAGSGNGQTVFVEEEGGEKKKEF